MKNPHTTAPMFDGMGVLPAYFNGFKHGSQGIVTTGICTLLMGSQERAAWMDGYKDGEAAVNPEPEVKS